MSGKVYPRPKQMKGLVASYYKKAVPIGIVMSTVLAYAFWRYTGVRHKRMYAEFYENYDADRDYIRMRESNVFQSAPALGHYKLSKIQE